MKESEEEKKILDEIKSWSQKGENRACFVIMTKPTSAREHAVSAGIGGNQIYVIESLASVLASTPSLIGIVESGIFESVLKLARRGEFKQAYLAIDRIRQSASKLDKLDRKVQEILDANTLAN